MKDTEGQVTDTKQSELFRCKQTIHIFIKLNVNIYTSRNKECRSYLKDGELYPVKQCVKMLGPEPRSAEPGTADIPTVLLGGRLQAQTESPVVNKHCRKYRPRDPE